MCRARSEVPQVVTYLAADDRVSFGIANSALLTLMFVAAVDVIPLPFWLGKPVSNLVV